MKDMRKTALLTLLAAAPLTSNCAEPPNAEDLVGSINVGAAAMYLNTDADRTMTANPLTSLDHGYGAGLQLGYRVTEAFELRGYWQNLNMEIERANAAKPDASVIGFDGLYFLDHRSFYLLGGVARFELEDDSMSANIGAGYRYYLSEQVAFHTEAKTYYDIDNDHTDFAVGVGLNYFFTRPTPEPEQPKDSDNDGIADIYDNCPNSAAGTTVNAQGCGDSDNDGVIDSNDLCPNSPPNAVVNTQGCGDDDKDGVANNLDKCPNSAIGVKVDNKGCEQVVKRETIELLIHFDNNKAVIKDEYLAEIRQVADFMTKYPKSTVELAGHTSSIGSAEHNQALSQRRAQAVAELLTQKYGIWKSRVTAKGYGESMLKYSGTTADDHAKNRRMEAKFTY